MKVPDIIYVRFGADSDIIAVTADKTVAGVNSGLYYPYADLNSVRAAVLGAIPKIKTCPYRTPGTQVTGDGE